VINLVHFIDAAKLKGIYPDASDEEITEINDSITRTIEEHCNTTFEEKEYTDEIHDSSYEIVPDHRPLNSVISLQDNGMSLSENGDFYVYPDKIIIVSPSNLRKALKMTYKAGFKTIPELVKVVALELARFRAFKENEGSLLFYKTQVVETREYEFDPDMTEERILSQLSRYQQPITAGNTRKNLRVGYIL
jgi:hypothetical protein